MYQKYDHNVYYTLSGDEALRTNVGQTQINMLYYLPESAWPLEAADEVTAEAFLKLLKSFYDALPEEIVKTTVIKRQVLIKVNFWFDMLLNYYGVWAPEFMSMGFTDEAQQGIVYWGEMTIILDLNRNSGNIVLLIVFLKRGLLPILPEIWLLH